MSERPIQKYLIHPLQGIITRALFWVMGLIPFALASAIGGWVGRSIGPLLPLNQRARDNLVKAFPDKNPSEINQIIKGMWDNLGRVAFEFPHIARVNVYDHPERFEIIGNEWVTELANDGKCGIFFSGHLANWEFSAKAVAENTPPLPVHLIFRAPNNPWMADLFDKRKPKDCGLIPKGAKGARQALNVLKTDGHLAMLVDQKMNDGIPVPFFGRDAMTAPAMAQFALKYDCPVIPVRIERLIGARFRITFHRPMEITSSGNKQDDIQRIMGNVNTMLESWISERPEQWLWLHRRWPKN